MDSLQELLSSDNSLSLKDFNDIAKKLFELNSDLVDVTDQELLCLAILVNLTSKAECRFDNIQNAKTTSSGDLFWTKFRKVASQLHTHNLKWPDSRVSLKHQIRVIPQNGELPEFGWAGNSSDYRIGRMLTSTFLWRGSKHSLVSVWLDDDVIWRKAAYKLGINKMFWYSIKQELQELFSGSHFPKEIDQQTHELLFPYQDNHYLTVTPVASHVDQLLIQSISGVPIQTLSFPHPSALGVLCGCMGGHMRFIKQSPLLRRSATKSSYAELQGVFNVYPVTCKQAVSIYREIIDVNTYSSLRLKRRARLLVLKQLDDVLRQWIAPFIRLKLIGKDVAETNKLSDEEHYFLRSKETDLQDFSRYLNRKLHCVLEHNKYTRSYCYHQLLLGVTQKRLASILERAFSINAKVTSDNEEELYLVLKNLRLTEANGLNNPYVAGMPSMIGLYGFLHRFERRLIDCYPQVSVESFALHCNQYQVINKNKLPAYSIPEKDMGIRRSGIVPECSFDGKFSIVVKLNRHSGCTDKLDVELLKQVLPERLWGGSLHPPFLYEETEWAQLFYGSNNLKQFIAINLFDGNWLTPVRGSGFDLSSNLELLKQKTKLSLCLVGYRLLEPIKSREVASGIHAFCESLISLCSREHSIDVIRAASNIEKQIFWQFMPTSQSCTTLQVGPVCGESNATSQST
jgi:CRISPR-associated protein Csy2